MRRNKHSLRLLLSGTLLLLLLLPACTRAKSAGREEAEESKIINFENILPNDGRRDQDRKDQESLPGDMSGDRPHELFYLNGLWSSVGAYDDDIYYEYDQIDEMSLYFENGWVAFTAGGETTIYQVEKQEDGMIYFTFTDASDPSRARICVNFHDIGYYLELTPENDPSFRILFERQ